MYRFGFEMHILGYMIACLNGKPKYDRHWCRSLTTHIRCFLLIWDYWKLQESKKHWSTSLPELFYIPVHKTSYGHNHILHRILRAVNSV